MRLILIAFVLISSNVSWSMMAIPGGCGSSCMLMNNMWGMPQFYPPVQMFPYGPSPMSFYANPMGYWPMMPRWNVPYYPGYIRGVSSDTSDVSNTEDKK